MGPTAVPSSFEFACWFLDRATEDREYFQPQKLHRLMFLAQAYYAVLQHGAKLMPGTFVAEDDGPIEPAILLAFARSPDTRPVADR